MNKKLKEFIEKYIEKGVHISRLRQYLVNSGYNLELIEAHINLVLKEFIKKHIRLGHEIDKIKQFLLNAGYEIEVVEEHLNHALRTKKNFRYILIFIALVLAILVTVSAFYYSYNPNKKPEVTSENISSKLQKESLEFFNQALIKNDTTTCDSIQDSILKEECQRRFLSNLSNVSNETLPSFYNESNIDKELLNKALISHNVSICSEIVDYLMKSQCEQVLKG